MNDIKTARRIVDELRYIMTQNQKKGAAIVFVSMIICSFLELIGVSAIYPFLDSMMNPEDLNEKWYVQMIQTINPNVSFIIIIIILSVFIIVVYLVKNVLALLCSYVQFKYSAKFKRELSTLMLDSYMKRPYEFFVNNNSAVVVRGINGDTTSTYQVLLDIFQFSAEFLTVVMIGIYLLATDLFVALAALLLAAICFFLIVFGFKKKMKRAGLAYVDASTKQFKYSYQAVNGIKEITAMNRRKVFVKQYEEAAREFERISLLNNFVSACPDRILEGICIGGFIGIACIRLVMGTEPSAFIPVLGTFALGAFKILPSISKMSSRVNSIVYNQAGLANCYDNIVEARNVEAERSRTNYIKENRCSHIEDLEHSFTSEIIIDNISWKYQNSKEDVLRGLSLIIKKGESIALIGASGAGKTTLADIILGLFKPQQGTITMDGLDIFEIPEIWAKTVGYVPQSVFLVDDTIRANIAFGLPEYMIDDTKIWSALEQAQLDEFVKDLPAGLNTIVGERGVKFSGGQRQRVAIARALYEDPEILILDEATSALDTDTEKAVMESIDALIGHKTMIIIAHRLSTIANCDKIYEVRDGVAIERGKDTVITENLIK